MAGTLSLGLARHLLRRAHEDAVRRLEAAKRLGNDGSPAEAEMTQFAVAHEEICELIGRHTLLIALCNLAKEGHGPSSYLTHIGMAGVAIGLPHPVVFDLETPRLGGVKPKGAGDGAAVVQDGGDRLAS